MRVDLNFDKALNYAYRLLKFRPRSEVELIRRLKKQRVTDAVIKKLISYLKEKGLIDDNEFAKRWVESRLRIPLGFRRLRAELSEKGINEKIISQVISEAKADYKEDQLVYKLARQKLSKLKNIEPYKAKRRLYAYFIRHGFSPDVVMETINQL